MEEEEKQEEHETVSSALQSEKNLETENRKCYGRAMSLHRVLGGDFSKEEVQEEEPIVIPQGTESCLSCKAMLEVCQSNLTVDTSDCFFLLDCLECGIR